MRETARGNAETRSNRGRNRKCCPGVHGARADHHGNRRNDYAPPEEAGQSRIRAICVSVHGLQGRAGIHERAEESAEGSRQKVEFYLRGTPLRKRIAIYLFTMLAFATLCGITSPVFINSVRSAS